MGFGFFDANNMPILCQVAEPQHRATGYGILNFFGCCIGGVAAYLGGWPFAAFWSLAAIGVFWEWSALVAGDQRRLVVMIGGATLVVSLGLAAGAAQGGADHKYPLRGAPVHEGALPHPSIALLRVHGCETTEIELEIHQGR